MSDRFAAVENWDDTVDISGVWKSIRGNMKS